MKRFLLFSVPFLLLASILKAQTVSITANPGTTQLNGLGSVNYHVSEYIYTETEIGASNFTATASAINKINLNASVVGTPNFFDNVKIYLKEVPTTTTALTASTYTTAGYTLVFSGTFTAPTVGWVGVVLNTPFVRTTGNNLQMMIERTDNVDHSSPAALFTWTSANGNNLSATAATSRRYNGTAALTSTTSLTSSAFRVATQFIHAVSNDAAVTPPIYAIGKHLIGSLAAQPITAKITNNGVAALTNLPVTLTVTGANTYTNTQTLTSLAVGSSAMVTFTGYNPTSVGSNTITISVPADDDNLNNSASVIQATTNNTFSYANGDTATSSIGYNTGAGILALKLKLSQARTLNSVRFSLSNTTANTGNVVYGVLYTLAGNLVAQSANYTIQSADLGTNLTFMFPTPISLSPDSTYLIGIAQTANATTGYFPLNVQTETPGRSSAYYGISGLVGGIATEYTTLGRFMIDALFNLPLPVSLTTFIGQRNGSNNTLTWTTASETNNTGFELQRSADGINYSTLAFVASKATSGNSSAALTYSFDDAKPLISNGYYRLKQIDKDGKSTTSNTVLIKGLPVSNLTVNTIYPNPVKNSMNVIVTAAAQATITLTVADFSGKVLSSQTKQMVSGDNQYQINTSALASGNYLLKVTDSKGETTTQRFTKQ